MAREHRYAVSLEWTGNLGQGTAGYRAYARSLALKAAGKPTIEGSSDPAFRGDPSRWNPEDLLVASLSACHMLWYLDLCAEAGIVVTAYRDDATGVMEEDRVGGRFTGVVLRPRVTVAAGADLALAERLHGEAHAKCFIARSVNFPVSHEPEIATAA
ncbi:MAG: OsmC family protein [Alphaproteobacteria bacterium]